MAAAAAAIVEPPVASAPADAAPAPAPAVTPTPAEAEAKAAPEGTTAKPEGEAEEPSLLSSDPEKLKDEADGQTDAKPADTPETYQAFELPDGFSLDEATLGKATPLFKELNLSQESAQKLVSFYADQLKSTTDAAQSANVKAYNDQVTAWRNESKVDAEFGGAKLAENLGVAKAFVTRFDSKGELISLLDGFGLSNHPVVLRFLTRAGKTISEDKAIPRGDGAPQERPKKPWEVMYPDLVKKE